MKPITIKLLNIIFSILLSIIFIFNGCTKMSDSVNDDSAGINGSFEHVKSGLPVNWLIYSPSTIPTGDYDLIIDTTEFKDGKQSLKFAVRECSQTGGWHSPGLSKEIDANENEEYKITFWIMNSGTEFTIRVGGVSAFEGEYETIIRSNNNIENWQLIEHTYTIPKDMNKLRIELNILKPGEFWIDDIKINKLDKQQSN